MFISPFTGDVVKERVQCRHIAAIGACRMSALTFGILLTVARFKIIESTDESHDIHPIGVRLYDRVSIN
jgi:hypothetical protein